MTTQQKHRKVIAIHGCAGTGKSTLARTLKAALEGNWQITSFATPLKDVVNDLFFKYEIEHDPFSFFRYEIEHDPFLDDEDKSLKSGIIDATRGRLLQETSDAIKNHFGHNIFCRIWDGCNRKGEYFIIDDLRFIEEADWLQDNCETIFVKIDGKPDLNDGRNPGHYGEMGLDVNRFDVVLPERFMAQHVNDTLGVISRRFRVGRLGVSTPITRSSLLKK
jgi:hypothetical protein